MKTKEELNALKEEVETQNRKLHELTEEELEQVSGGSDEPLGSSGVLYDRPHRHEAVNPDDGCPFGTCGSCNDYRFGLCYWDGN